MSATQTAAVVAYIRSRPGASSLEITLATGAVNVTGRVSDARAEGVVIECRTRWDKRKGYWLVVPKPVTAGEQTEAFA